MQTDNKPMIDRWKTDSKPILFYLNINKDSGEQLERASILSISELFI